MKTENRATIDRTKEQKFANELDRKLYMLIVRVERQKEQYWHSVAAALRDARPLIRLRMHQKDRETTI